MAAAMGDGKLVFVTILWGTRELKTNTFYQVQPGDTFYSVLQGHLPDGRELGKCRLRNQSRHVTRRHSTVPLCVRVCIENHDCWSMSPPLLPPPPLLL